LRKVGATVLAVPVLAAIYLAALRAHGGFQRLLAGLGAAVVIAVVAAASLPPAHSSAIPAAEPAPVAARVLDAVRTGHSLTAPIEVSFDAPMDAASVAGALRISPDSAISVSWDRAGRRLTIAPADHWRPDTLYTVTIDPSARSEAGGRLGSPVRAVVLTRAAATATIKPTRALGNRTRPDSAFVIRLDRPVALSALRAALRSEPTIRGDLEAGTAAGEYRFTPWSALGAKTRYRLWLDGLLDDEGVPFEAAPAIAISTAKAPSVVRFRPVNGTDHVERDAILSVRFTQPMDREATAAAFRVTSGGHSVTGRVAWAEGSTVLVFDPSKALAYGASVVMSVDGTARSRGGSPVAAARATFKVAPKPRARTAATGSGGGGGGGSRSISRSGGGGAANGSWGAVERYYLRLMNCTRTGGWVNGNGNCNSPGGRNVDPLFISDGISDAVSRPYAKHLAQNNQCDHFIGGTPGDRLRRAGYDSYRWAENLGCRSGNPYNAVLGSHLYFQSEKPYNGGHYRNLMNPDYDRCGIGVWVAGGRVRLVVDFYHP
jgi:Bacterial Ig-like domain